MGISLKKSLAYRDFRLLWSAQILSELGDWAARVALAVLVYDKTGSRVLTAAITGVTMLPWLGLGQALATLGDRFPRRRIMVSADVIRAAMFAAMVVAPNVWLILVLAFVAAAATPPFEAARSALMPEVVGPDEYGDALAIGSITYQAILVLGYLAGGGLVAWLHPRGALVVDACTFLVSAGLLAALRGGRATPPRTSMRASFTEGAQVLFGDPFLRRALLLTTIGCSCAMVGEALVAVYVRERIAGTDAMVGLMAAAVPAGTIIVAALAPKKGEHADQLRASAAIVALGASFAFIGFVIAPPNALAAVAFAGLGVSFAAIIPAQTVVGTRVPNERRATVFGLLQGTLFGGQAIASIAGGVLANVVGPGPAIALASIPAIGYGLFAVLVVPRQKQSKTIDLLTPKAEES